MVRKGLNFKSTPFAALILALTYCIVGKLSTYLAIPPGYATCIWPASGIAVGSLVLFGNRLWPGILLGSFLVNVSTSFDSTSVDLILRSLFVPIGIGIGAALQALYGSYLVNRFVSISSGLVTSKSIFTFFFLAGPLSCLISASCGVVVLWLTGLISFERLFLSWSTWWVGDVIGVILTVPIMLIWFGQPRELWRVRNTTVVIPLIITIFLAVAFFMNTQEQEHQRVENEFSRHSLLIKDALDKKLARYVEALYSVHDLLELSKSIDRVYFSQIVQGTLERNPGIHGISWNNVVYLNDRHDFEQKIQNEGFADFGIKEKSQTGQMIKAGQRGRYIVVNFIEPMKGNEKAFGYDVYSDALRQKAMDLAESTGKLVATSPIQLVQETGQQVGVLLFLPVYHEIHKTEGPSKNRLKGFVVGVFRMGDLLVEAFNSIGASYITTKLLDPSVDSQNPLLASHAFGGREENSDELFSVAPPPFQWKTTIRIGQRSWNLVIEASDQFLIQYQSWIPWSMLIIGFIFPAVLGMLLMVLTGHAILDHQKASVLANEVKLRQNVEQSLTKSEKLYKDTFEHAGVGIAHVSPKGRWLKVNDQLCVILGYSRDELLNSNILDIIFKKDRQSTQDKISQMLSGSYEFSSYEKRYIHKNGDPVWVSQTMSLIKAADDEFNKFIFVIEDITKRKKLESELVENKNFISKALNTSLAGIYIYNIESGANEFINDRYTKITGYTLDEINRLSPSQFTELLHPEDRKQVFDHIKEVIKSKNNEIFGIEYRFKRQDGQWIWCLSWDSAFTRDEKGQVKTFIGTFIDITERKGAQEKILISEEKYRLAMEATQDGLWDWDIANKFVYFSPAWRHILGETEVKNSYSAWEDRIYSEDKERVLNSLSEHLEGVTDTWQEEHRLVKEDGNLIWVLGRGHVVKRDENGSPLRMIGTMSDINIQKQNEEMIWQKANYDSLTELPNRNLFHELLNNAITHAQRSRQTLWILFMDLDGFKEVNDTFGHNNGDLLLKQVAGRIHSTLRQSDTVARLGGDEFVVILSNVTDIADVDKVAANLLNSIGEKYVLNKETVYVTASIGIANYPNDADNAENLLKFADQSMYAAKKEGKNRYTYFTPVLQKASQLRIMLSNDLRKAIDNNEFQLYYQPIVNLKTGKTLKAEALLRWIHPEKGFFNPGAFISIAEETGIICDIGNWIFDQVFSRLEAWQACLGQPFQLSINMSPVQLKRRDKEYDGWIDIVNSNQMGPSLVLEITEGLLLHNEPTVNNRLLRYRDSGIQVAIDDFGTGYSSLSYLKNFDIDYLKIDQAFVQSLEPNNTEESISEAIIVMAHKLGLKVIAEGVENQKQRDILKSMGCDYAQGYFYSKPLPLELFEEKYIFPFCSPKIPKVKS